MTMIQIFIPVMTAVTMIFVTKKMFVIQCYCLALLAVGKHQPFMLVLKNLDLRYFYFSSDLG